jgi:hypothetical protein
MYAAVARRAGRADAQGARGNSQGGKSGWARGRARRARQQPGRQERLGARAKTDAGRPQGQQPAGQDALGAQCPRRQLEFSPPRLLSRDDRSTGRGPPSMPLTIAEDDYVIVDNGAASPGELAIGHVCKVDEEPVEVHWHALRDASVPTPMQVGGPRGWAPTGRCGPATAETYKSAGAVYYTPSRRSTETRRWPSWRGYTRRHIYLPLNADHDHDRMSSDLSLVYRDHRVQQDEVLTGYGPAIGMRRRRSSGRGLANAPGSTVRQGNVESWPRRPCPACKDAPAREEAHAFRAASQDLDCRTGVLPHRCIL